MPEDIVIRVENVSKKFSRNLKHAMLYGVQDIGKNMINLKSNSEILREGEFWALNDISFHVKRGESIGIIGANGSGKSTMLKLLNGIFMPDKGKIEIKGKVGALIEVGAGFHQMLTGRENIYINGAILGMNKKEIDRKFDEIVDFADIGDFIDTPVKHYSSGMYMRLGFAVAVHSEPDILLIDEVLAVGDAKFQKKCFDKMNFLKEEGRTIILVSHALDVMRTFPTSAILVDHGQVLYTGDSGEAVLKYLQKLFPERMDVHEDKSIKTLGAELRDLSQKKADAVSNQDKYCLEIIPHESAVARSFGAGGAWINWIKIFGLKKPNVFHGGEEIEVQISFSWDQYFAKDLIQKHKLANNLIVGCGFDNLKGITMFGFNSFDGDYHIDPSQHGKSYVSFKISLPVMMEGAYFMYPAVALGIQEHNTQLRWYPNLIHLQCIPDKKYIYGVMKINYSVMELEA